MALINIKRKLWRISFKNSGVWAMFSMWLAVLSSITYGNLAQSKAAANFYLLMLNNDPTITSDEFSLFQFFTEVARYSTNTTIVLLLCLILAVLRPIYRLKLMGITTIATIVLSTGLLEKIIYAQWFSSNETIIKTEIIRKSPFISGLEINNWWPNSASITHLEPVLAVMMIIIIAATLKSIFDYTVSNKKLTKLIN